MYLLHMQIIGCFFHLIYLICLSFSSGRTEFIKVLFIGPKQDLGRDLSHNRGNISSSAAKRYTEDEIIYLFTD